MRLCIYSEDNIHLPPIEGSVTLKTERKGAPAELEFSVVLSGELKLEEGMAVSLEVHEHKVFFGFIFTLKRDKEGIIGVTAYDQLRYLKNKDTYVYSNKTAGELIKMIAEDFNLRCGEIEDTAYKIPSRVEDNVTLMDMIYNALDLTLTHKKEMYVLYDDYGKICLKNISSMVVPILIDEESCENYDYSSSIDSDTYNKIKLTYDNDKTGRREVYIAQHGDNINSWGVLQYFDTLNEGENGKAKADALLGLYNHKTKTLSLSGVLGDPRVRGGSMIVVRLDVSGDRIDNLMIVEKCTHKYGHDEHTMELTLRGGDINA